MLHAVDVFPEQILSSDAGECGRRGGYVEVVNVPEDVAAEMYKLASINLCSNVNGQICTAMVMNPPVVSFSLTQADSGSVPL